jgi:hypothetical protein
MPERVVWGQRAEKELQIYLALRPDSFCEWSVKNHMEELANEDAQKNMAFWYEMAVDEQKKELREYKKKAKALPAQIEPISVTVEGIEGGLPQGQGDGLELIKV